MIGSFFQSLERNRVEYLLISGQAAVLYGAAAFSEDIDLWVRPSRPNAEALLTALRQTGARYYKLTPPVTEPNLLRGHVFHFVIPDEPDAFVDVMGCPPRVSDFEHAREDSRIMSTSWGRLPTLGIPDLVEIKKTQRMGDYPVIGRLVLRRIEESPRPAPGVLRWALDNVYSLEDLDDLLSSFGHLTWESDCRELAAYLAADQAAPRPEALVEAVESVFAARMAAARRADRLYWSPVIDELRRLRAADKLMPVGQPV